MGYPPADGTSTCPCGCGAEFITMVAEREAGVRADAAAAATDQLLSGRDAASRVFLITGMPGAGKSTVARALALRFDRAAHVDIDMVFHHFTVSGKADPAYQSPEESAQAMLAARNAAGMARNYADAGFVCVLDGAVVKREQVMACARAVSPHKLFLVVLAPPLPVSEDRDKRRSGKNVAGYFRHLHPVMHEQLTGLGLWLDTSQQLPAQSVTSILSFQDRAVVTDTGAAQF